MRNIKDLNVSLVVFLVVLIFATSYVFFRSREFIEGPVLTLHNIKNGSTVNKEAFEISGQASNISFLTLNGRQIFTDENGEFSEKLMLATGYNIVTIEAKDRFDRIATESLRLVYNQAEAEEITNVSL